MRARDIMIKDFITVSEDTDVWELARLFTVKRITGAPVISGEGALVGVVSQTDIIRHLKDVASGAADDAADFYKEPEPDRPIWAAQPVTARDLMSPSVISAPEQTTIHELGSIMLQHKIHRIIITSGGRLAGIVTTMDMLKVL